MKISIRFLLKGTVWTLGAYGCAQVLRLVTNIALARLLTPELFGIMLIVNSLGMGIELMSDIGIGQNIIYQKNANDPEFYNTAWTLQAIRGVVLWLVALAFTVPVAQFYQSPILAIIMPFTTFGIVLSGFTSISRPLLQKRLQITKLNIFETIVSLFSSAVYVLLAYLSPTIWALVFGGLFGPAVTMIGSYCLLSDVKQRFNLSRRFAWEIVYFGKWIYVSSFVYFLSAFFDRLYLAKVVPLELLGVYGIARTFSELLGMMMQRLGNYVLFPFIASQSQMPRTELRAQLASIRAKFMVLAAVGFSFFVATGDLAIRLLYDQRYQAASWMLPVLFTGSWFSIMANLNEATLLGLGKPSYTAISYSSKFVFLLVGLPLGVKSYGLLGGITVVVLADLCRYIPVLIGQRRERFSFGMQDLLITFAGIAMIGLWEWLRWISGFGTSFDSLPIDNWSVIWLQWMRW
jgi:O-antigen/teichoic acid export membrane protein